MDYKESKGLCIGDQLKETIMNLYFTDGICKLRMAAQNDERITFIEIQERDRDLVQDLIIKFNNEKINANESKINYYKIFNEGKEKICFKLALQF